MNIKIRKKVILVILVVAIILLLVRCADDKPQQYRLDVYTNIYKSDSAYSISRLEYFMNDEPVYKRITDVTKNKHSIDSLFRDLLMGWKRPEK